LPASPDPLFNQDPWAQAALKDRQTSQPSQQSQQSIALTQLDGPPESFDISTPRAISMEEAEAQLAEVAGGGDLFDLDLAIEAAVRAGVGEKCKAMRRARRKKEELEDAELEAVGEDEDKSLGNKRRSPDRDGPTHRGGVGVARPSQQAASQRAYAEAPPVKPPWLDDVVGALEARMSRSYTQKLAELGARQDLLTAKVSNQGKEIVGHKGRLDQLDQGQGELRRDVDRALEAARRAEERSSASGSSAGFVPRSLSIKGACAFGMVDSEGFTSEFAAVWVEKARGLLPGTLRAAMGDYTLKGLSGSGGRAASITVRVLAPDQLSDLMRVLGKMMKDNPELLYHIGEEQRQLYLTPERSEADQLRYRTMGRLKDRSMKLREKMGDKAEGEVQIAWKPRFAVVDGETDDAVVSVRDDGTLLINEGGAKKLFGLSARDLRRELQGSF
jgi:hypothetical protein